MKKPVALVIMDGYGLSETKANNAVVGNSPYVDYLRTHYPSTTLTCSGRAVGLPDGQMGNSEVGHLNMGAGRVVYQDLLRISNAVADGSFFTNEVLISACEKAQGGSLHLLGLVSDGGVHSHLTHIYALLELAKSRGVKNCYVHCFLDGRDTPPTAGAVYVKKLQDKMAELNYGVIASVCGRYYAMDRDNRWDRLEKAYDMLVLGQGERNDDAVNAIKTSYDKGITDEFMLPTVITANDAPVALIKDGDSVLFFNFRPDRARELTRALTQPNFDAFSLKGKKVNVHYTCMTKYDETFALPIAYPDLTLVNTLGEYLSTLGIQQLRTAETEKYAHVTFFFNGGVEHANEGETRMLIPSPNVATYDLQPQMSAYTVTDRALAELAKDKYDFMVLNYANCDMVGHTGNYDATCAAVRTVDECVRKLAEYILLGGGVMLLTADHGNAEKMKDKSGVFTAHTTNNVPFILISNNAPVKLRDDGALCDVAPTVLDVMNLPQPTEMTGKSLIVK